MNTYFLYKVLHIVGVVLLFAALGGLTLREVAGDDSPKSRALGLATHGIALTLIFITGMAALMALGLGAPPWVLAKMVLWLVIAALPVVIRKMPRHATLLWWLLPILGGLAAWLAIYKPWS